jgi:uncharacterized protein (DUF697 family)
MVEKQQQARDVVRRYMLFSAGAGVIPIPFLDGVAVSGVQLKMLSELSKIYGVPFRENLGKAAVASLAGFVIPHAGAFGALSGAIPGLSVLGAPLAAAFAGVYCWAMGNMFIQHFESGGTFLNLKPEELRNHFQSQFERREAPVASAVEA